MKQVYFKVITILLLFGYGAQNTVAQAPITASYIAYGEVDYQSSLNSADMHFYMFGDGYYQWQHSPNNFFESNPAPGFQTLVYHAVNKDPVEPDLYIVDTGETTDGTVQTAPLTMNPNIHMKTSWNITDYSTSYVILNFENKFKNEPSDGCVEFIFLHDDLYVDTANIIIKDDWAGPTKSFPHNPNRLRWYYEDLAPNEQRVIYIPVQSLRPAGHSTLVKGKIKDNCQGRGISQGGLVTISNWPHDPNSLTVTNKRYLSYSANLFDEYGETEQYLDYEVQFHNDGDGPVNTVVVNVEFEGSYGTGTAAIISSSHDVEISDSGSDFIEFTFENINLAGAGENVPFSETVGKVKFQICLLDDIAKDDCEAAQADIYFDALAPITANHEICSHFDPNQYNNPCSLGSHIEISGSRSDASRLENQGFEISPNPASDLLFVDHSDFKKITGMKILDLQGQKIMEYDSYQSTINLGRLSDGVYIIQVYTENGPISKRFVKQ